MTRYFDLVPGYESLATVYDSAIEQASEGKGRERHAEAGEPYERQIICEVSRRVGLGYPLGQAVKKIYESQRIGGERGVAELLGALNYVAAAVIVMREQEESEGNSFQDGNSSPETNHPEIPDSSPKFKPGDRVQYRVELPSVSDWIWRDATYLRPAFSWQQDGEHIVSSDDLGPVTVKDKDVRLAPKAEGCESLVEHDAPQTPAELYDKIIASNPATFGRPRTPTGEELAEMAEEEGNA